MEVSDYTFPDAPMIARLRERESAQPWVVRARGTLVEPELRRRLDAIRESQPFPEEAYGQAGAYDG